MSLTLLLSVNAARGTKAFWAQHGERAPLRAHLVAAGAAALSDEELSMIFPVPAIARERLETLERLGMGPRRDAATADPPVVAPALP